MGCTCRRRLPKERWAGGGQGRAWESLGSSVEVAEREAQAAPGTGNARQRLLRVPGPVMTVTPRHPCVRTWSSRRCGSELWVESQWGQVPSSCDSTLWPELSNQPANQLLEADEPVGLDKGKLVRKGEAPQGPQCEGALGPTGAGDSEWRQAGRPEATQRALPTGRSQGEASLPGSQARAYHHDSLTAAKPRKNYRFPLLYRLEN